MPTDSDLDKIKTGAAVVGELLKAAGDNPDAKQAGRELAKAALTVTKAINVVMLPLAAVNFGYEKARTYFQEKFADDLAARTETIPPEHVVEPKASIAGPALQGLAFAHEDVDLKELYLQLLASSMDDRVSSNVHPAFVEILRQISADDAKLLRTVLISHDRHSIVEVKLRNVKTGHYRTLRRHFVNLTDEATGAPLPNIDVPAMVENWIRLGLVNVTYLEWLTPEHYGWVANRSEYQEFQTLLETDEERVFFQSGMLERTSFGENFGRAVGMLVLRQGFVRSAAPGS